MNKKEKLLNKSIKEPNSSIPNQANIIEIVAKSSIFKYFLGGMVIFGICFIACLFTFQILLTQIGVVGYSMQPTINISCL